MILVLIKRFLGNRDKLELSSGHASSPEIVIHEIQSGDLRLRNDFIAQYQPFVAKAASRFCKRYIDPSRNDEFTVALAAFNEAIDQFSPEAGKSFLGFAETVIRRRLIDYVRKEQRFAGQVSYSSFNVEDDEDNVMNPVEAQQAIQQFELQRDSEERRGEIMELARVLLDFGIGFGDLAKESPKHEDSRKTLLWIGSKMAEDHQMMRLVLSKRQLPIKELLEQVDVSRKTLERNRKFLIAVSIIYNGPYPYLREYISKPERRGG